MKSLRVKELHLQCIQIYISYSSAFHWFDQNLNLPLAKFQTE